MKPSIRHAFKYIYNQEKAPQCELASLFLNIFLHLNCALSQIMNLIINDLCPRIELGLLEMDVFHYSETEMLPKLDSCRDCFLL